MGPTLSTPARRYQRHRTWISRAALRRRRSRPVVGEGSALRVSARIEPTPVTQKHALAWNRRHELVDLPRLEELQVVAPLDHHGAVVRDVHHDAVVVRSLPHDE